MKFSCRQNNVFDKRYTATEGDKKTGRSQGKLNWHPAFLQAIRLDLFDYRDSLEFKYEYQLTSEPLRIDLLIIKKPKQLAIEKDIARIFRTDNLLEYKSPEDYLSVKDFLKVYAYANLYAAISPDVDLSDITITFIGGRYPRKLINYFVDTRAYTVEETSGGIYYVSGDYVPIQIIHTKKLSDAENLWLKSLRKGLEVGAMSAILEKRKQGILYEIFPKAYFDVLLRANPKTFLELYKMQTATFEEVFTEAGIIPQWIERGIEKGIEKGIEQGKEKTALNLLAMGMPIEKIAQVTELPVEKVSSLIHNQG